MNIAVLVVGGASRLTIYPGQQVAGAMIINTKGIPDAEQFVQGIAEGFLAGR